MIEIPQAVKDLIESLKADVKELSKKVDFGTAKSVAQTSEAKLAEIRKESLFQGMGKQPAHKHGEGKYPFALYKKSDRLVPQVDKEGKPMFDANMNPKMTGALDRRGDPLVDVMHVKSDDEMAAALADGWFVNPLGMADKRSK